MQDSSTAGRKQGGLSTYLVKLGLDADVSRRVHHLARNLLDLRDGPLGLLLEGDAVAQLVEVDRDVERLGLLLCLLLGHCVPVSVYGVLVWRYGEATGWECEYKRLDVTVPDAGGSQEAAWQRRRLSSRTSRSLARVTRASQINRVSALFATVGFMPIGPEESNAYSYAMVRFGSPDRPKTSAP